jgi:hypothetical protein
MDHDIARRDFLKAAPAAAGILVAIAQAPALQQQEQPSAPKVGSQAYTPVTDYPIRAKRFSEVTMTDDFWKPRIALNASVTIPQQSSRLGDPEDGLRGNVLEAAIYSLEANSGEPLRAQVEARVESLRRIMEERQRPSNNGFEIAVAWYNATGKRTLLDPAIKQAAALYEDLERSNPPFSGGERDAINCLQLYRATRDRKHLDLAKHYLDIRGLPTSVNRSRHNQSYKPVLEQTEAVGHAVNGVTLMVSMADVGVLTGLGIRTPRSACGRTL